MPQCFPKFIRRWRDTKDKWLLLSTWGVLIGTFGATSASAPNNVISYVSFVTAICLYFFMIFWKPQSSNDRGKLFCLFDILPATQLGVWGYGVIWGMINSNPYQNILRNNAGILVCVLYFIFILVRSSRRALLECLIFAAWVTAIVVASFFLFDKLFSKYFYGVSYFAQLSTRSYFSESVVLLIVPICLVLSGLFSQQSWRNTEARNVLRVLYLYTLSFLLLVPMQSKALSVAFLLILVCFAVAIYRALPRMNAQQVVMASCSILIPFVATAWLTSYLVLNAYSTSVVATDPTSKSFSVKVLLSDSRIEQTHKLYNEFSIFGSGSGAVLRSGYARDSAGYGFESSYANIIHKFGIFALPLFLGDLAILAWIVVSFNSLIWRPYAAVSLAVVGVDFIAIGNPVYTGPIAIMLKTIIFYWMRGYLIWRQSHGKRYALSCSVATLLETRHD
ncbi:hypothetical protein MWR57_03770 [Desulfovibrionaceae bacterium CB1MN]|uniref:hypothetical protein n=1 Tax=Hydrosulfovibrio ferrireducens TaxID=2934181 RepID=UPI003ABA35EE